MRSEKEMFNLILGFANEQEDIRAVYMNGSRANPAIEKDQYQDYDIVYVVKAIAGFRNNQQWLDLFGEIALIQEPNLQDAAWGNQQDFNNSYTWLILFKDGNRIDLTLKTKNQMLLDYEKDSLTMPLLDKDHCLPTIPEANDKDYRVKKPSQKQFYSVTNNFWWCLQNTAKGIKRDQITYVMNMYYQVIHKELEEMLSWYIGTKTDFSLTVGLWGKYYKKYLPQPLYVKYLKTYADSDYSHLWEAIFTACDLFRQLSKDVAAYFQFSYNEEEDHNMMQYLQAVKNNLLV